MRKVGKIIVNINQFMFWIVSFMIIILSLVVFASVIARHFLSTPIIWSFDLSKWLTGLIAFLSGGYVLLHKQHVNVDIIYGKVSNRTRSFMDIFSSFFILSMVMVFIWNGSNQVIHHYELGSISSSGLNVPMWLFWVMVPVGGFLLGLQAVFNLINDISTIIIGKKLWEVEI